MSNNNMTKLENITSLFDFFEKVKINKNYKRLGIFTFTQRTGVKQLEYQDAENWIRNWIKNNKKNDNDPKPTTCSSIVSVLNQYLDDVEFVIKKEEEFEIKKNAVVPSSAVVT